MTEELKTCDFYNEKICTLFSKYFGFNVECKNLFLSTIDCDIERECPIKRLEQENKELSFAIEKCLENAGIECDDEEQALRSLPMLGNAHYKVLVEKEELKQENKELKEMYRLSCLKCEYKNTKADVDRYRSALEKIKGLCTHYENTNDKCVINCYAHFIVTDLIQNKINEILNKG